MGRRKRKQSAEPAEDAALFDALEEPEGDFPF